MLLSHLDPLIGKKSLLMHPFYQKWSKGELTLEDLQVYAKEYFHLVERIPGIVTRVRERVTDPAFAERIKENEIEEQEHVGLWKRFAKSVGISEQELMSYQPSTETISAVRQLELTAEQGKDEGIACMYALEAELPKIAQTKKEGLRDFYNLTSEDAQIYFDEHLGEEKHLEVWRMFPVDSVRGTAAAEASMAAQNQVLDAVCGLRGISMAC
jgi:pyrroloquinoline-quinone synthase